MFHEHHFQMDLSVIWVAGKLAAEGSNPYDTALLAERMKLLGWADTLPTMVFQYPPWCFWIFVPLSYIPFELLRAAWPLLILFVCALCFRWCVRLLGAELAGTPPEILGILAVCFFPFLKLLVFGQTSFIPLAGLTLFLLLRAKDREALSGAALSLTLLKAHLLLPFLAACAVAWQRERKWRAPAGLCAGLGLQMLLSLAFYPQAEANFVSTALRRSLRHVASERPIMPNLPYLLSSFSGIEALYIPGLLAGILGAMIYAARRDALSQRGLAILLPASIVFAPYYLSHDLVLLLLPYLGACASGLKRRSGASVAIVLGLGAAAAASFASNIRNESYTVLLPFALLAWGCWIQRARKKKDAA